MINVLCAGLSENETKHFIHNSTVAEPSGFFIGPTAVDDLFEFNATISQQAPWFPKLPIPWNSLGFISSGYGSPAIYILAAPAPPENRQPYTYDTSDYVLCSIKSAQYRNCTTYYHVAQSGGQMSVECDKSPMNTLPYFEFIKNAAIGNWEADWKDVGEEWLRSIGLNEGINDANASSARLITQFVPAWSEGVTTDLPIAMPTIGEALAVLAGGSAVLSSSRSPFIAYWNYSRSVLTDPQYEDFPARVSYKDYASGGTQEWQGLFYVILVAVFLLSLFSLGYLLWTFCLLGRVTDYTEPQNLFALAINSPPSSTMSGTCGAGPSGGLLAKKWEVDMQKSGGSQMDRGTHPHFFVRCKEESVTERPAKRRMRRSQPPTISSFSIAESPAVEQYMRLSGK